MDGSADRSNDDAVHEHPPGIAEHAAVGDGRTVALITRDGTVDWLPSPSVDSPTVFGALLDQRRGGRFELRPLGVSDVVRRYLPDTNVLESTFVTGRGVARVTDAMTLPLGGGLHASQELVRRIDGVSGVVPFEWCVAPRFDYGSRPPEISTRGGGVPVASAGADALAVSSWDAGEPHLSTDTVSGSFEITAGASAIIALSIAHAEPLVFPARSDVAGRLTLTADWWRGWVRDRSIHGPWRDAVVRSALALKLLVHAPTGAVAAAPTTSLPEEIGGERNWDYRFCWVRDSAFVMDALLGLGCSAEAEAFFWWLMHASQITHPRLQVLYRLDGGARAPERILPMEGYAGSRPVRIGNGAIDQLQLDVYGDLLQTAWLYARAGGRVDREFGRRLAEIADLVCTIWRSPDSGIWEVRSEPRHFTHSKMMCWVALDRASRLARTHHIPAHHLARWKSEGDAIRRYVETRCWSHELRSYVRSEGSEHLDASVLLGAVFGYRSSDEGRWPATFVALRQGLATGPLLDRYTGDDGLHGQEGAFLACSLWLVEALARWGYRRDAVGLMDDLVKLTNDVGLLSEEIDPDTSAFLGNFPQGLTHLSLIGAAKALEESA